MGSVSSTNSTTKEFDECNRMKRLQEGTRFDLVEMNGKKLRQSLKVSVRMSSDCKQISWKETEEREQPKTGTISFLLVQKISMEIDSLALYSVSDSTKIAVFESQFASDVKTWFKGLNEALKRMNQCRKVVPKRTMSSASTVAASQVSYTTDCYDTWESKETAMAKKRIARLKF